MSEERKVVSLYNHAVPGGVVVDDGVVSVLEKFLALAKAGDLTAVAIAGVRPNGNVTTGWVADHERNALGQALTHLGFRYQYDLLDGMKDTE